MYQEISKISYLLSEPFVEMSNGTQAPIMIAFFLGFIGALSPCQLTGNISAITLYGNRSVQTDNYWGDVIFFVLGKMIVFSVLGIFAWLIGQSFEEKMTMLFPLFRKVIGPLLIFVGLFLLGLINLQMINRLTEKVPMPLKSEKVGSFFMGASFSFAFCPTMFVLFFVTLLPVVFTTSYGFFLSAVFGIATSIPLLLILVIFSFLGFNGTFLKRSKQVGLWVQRIAGAILILLGVVEV